MTAFLVAHHVHNCWAISTPTTTTVSSGGTVPDRSRRKRKAVVASRVKPSAASAFSFSLNSQSCCGCWRQCSVKKEQRVGRGGGRRQQRCDRRGGRGGSAKAGRTACSAAEVLLCPCPCGEGPRTLHAATHNCVLCIPRRWCCCWCCCDCIGPACPPLLCRIANSRRTRTCQRAPVTKRPSGSQRRRAEAKIRRRGRGLEGEKV